MYHSQVMNDDWVSLKRGVHTLQHIAIFRGKMAPIDPRGEEVIGMGHGKPVSSLSEFHGMLTPWMLRQITVKSH